MIFDVAKLLKQKIIFKASPSEVYSALMDEKKHSAFTGAKAEIENKVGGNFSAWDGYIEGENLELVPGKKIVQKWRASDWAKGKYSTVTYELSPKSDGCQLTFTQVDIPDENFDEIEQGWTDFYWEHLKEWFNNEKMQ